MNTRNDVLEANMYSPNKMDKTSNNMEGDMSLMNYKSVEKPSIAQTPNPYVKGLSSPGNPLATDLTKNTESSLHNTSAVVQPYGG